MSSSTVKYRAAEPCCNNGLTAVKLRDNCSEVARMSAMSCMYAQLDGVVALKGKKAKKQKVFTPTAPSIPRRSPIQVLTRLDVA